MVTFLPDSRFKFQKTLKRDVVLKGAGVHSNQPCSIVLKPAEADTGVVFSIKNKGGQISNILAHVDNVSDTRLCTVLSDGENGQISTVEHLMAALCALEVDNVIVEADGRETPILDGSSRGFVEAIRRSGLKEQAANRRYIKVVKPVRVEQGDAFCELLPFEDGCRIEVGIHYDDNVIGSQYFDDIVAPESFCSDLCDARTFGFLKDVEMLRKAGLALGSSLENSVGINEGGIMNPEGLRFEDEFVRHKALDAIGDLALAGLPLLAHFRSSKGGHTLNVKVVRALLSDEAAWAVVRCEDEGAVASASFVHGKDAPVAALHL